MLWSWLMLIAGAQSAATLPLPAEGKWEVNYADKSCVLARAFGPPERRVLLGITALPLASSYMVTMDRPGGLVKKRNDPVRFAISDKPAEKASYWTMSLPRPGVRRLVFNVSDSLLDDASDEAKVSVTEPGGEIVLLDAHRLAGAMAALRTCANDLAESWGVDKATLDKVAKRSVGANDLEWITADDYPSVSLRNGEEGKVFILWRIDVDGRVSDCRTVVSSGHPLLDEAACKAIVARARYKPALDATGNPTVSYASRAVVWSRPRF